MNSLTRLGAVIALSWVGLSTVTAADKNLILIAGRPSHGPLDHEFRAGSLLWQKCLVGVPGLHVEVHTNGWINDPKAFDRADAVVIYADGDRNSRASLPSSWPRPPMRCAADPMYILRALIRTFRLLADAMKL